VTPPTGDLHLPPLILGIMARSHDRPEARMAVMDSALTQGVRTFDTAPLYGFGQADALLGRVLDDRTRREVSILGKVGLRWGDDAVGDVLFETRDADGERVVVRRDSRPEAVIDDVMRSLERLGVERLDLVQIHQPDRRTPIGETMAALEDLQHAGIVGHIGVCNFDARQVEAARAAASGSRLFSLQTEYSLIRRQCETELVPACRRQQVALLAYSPLAGGRLTGAGMPGDPALARAIDGGLRTAADRLGVAPAALALRWVIEQPGVRAAVTGASSPAQLRALGEALEAPVTPEMLSDLGAAFARVAAAERRRAEGGPLASLRKRAGELLRRIGLDPAGPGSRGAAW